MGVELGVKLRNDKGKSASRRLRREFRVPGIIYGIKKEPLPISLDFHKLDYLLEYDNSIYTSAISLDVEGSKESVILKDLQRNPYFGYVTHADFLRIDDKHHITTMVPINIINTEQNSALRLGAMLNEFIASVEVVCLPKDLPHGIEVDILALKLGESIGLLDLNIPKGVVIKSLTHGNKEDYNQTVLSISEPKIIPIEEDEVEDDTTEVESSEDGDAIEEENKDNKEDNK